MCGIVGILSNDFSILNTENLKKMSDVIQHRGPDGEGFWIDNTNSIGFGHRRLSIIDLSNNAKQPMHYMDRYTITFNGEIYNYLEIKKILEKKGYHFKSQSDTEVLLALFDLKKELCLQDLDGMFAFAIWDKHEEKLFCARDRFGEKPFYYFKDKDKFCFSSEMKSLWALTIPKEPNHKKLFQFLAYNAMDDFSQEDSTFYKNIYSLKPANFLVINKNKEIITSEYWNIDLNNKINPTEDEAKECFYSLFEESIAKRLRADVDVGICLSGGLDSSSIAVVVDQLINNTQRQKSFSARFPGFEKDEGDFIKLILNKTSIENHDVFLTTETLEKQIEMVSYFQEEPFGGTSIVAEWNVMNLARENNTKVVLNGQGSDEYLAGYRTQVECYLNNLKWKKSSLYKKEKLLFQDTQKCGLNDNFIATMKFRFPTITKNISSLKNRLVLPNYIQQFERDYLDEFVNYNSPFLRPTTLDGILYNFTFKSGLNHQLRWADRNSMANSVEVRLPFLYHKMVEYVFSLPDNLKLKEGWTKFILRKSLESKLPNQICWRKEKIGFEPPKSNHISTEKIEEAKKTLIQNGILNPKFIIDEFYWNYYQIYLMYYGK